MSRRAGAILLLLYLASGVYMVPAGYQAVVRRFGRVAASPVSPGIHYRLPWPAERVDRVKVREQQRVSVGLEVADEALGADREAGQFLTGDQNIINVPVMVQYTISDPRDYLFTTADVPLLIRKSTEASLARVISLQEVDYVLTIGRSEVQNLVQEEAQRLLDTYRTGVSISSVNLMNVQPPGEVKDAFADVASAREDRTRIVNEAYGYMNDLLPRARGEASKSVEDARAYREQRINESRGDAARFLKAWEQYRVAKDVTSARLYLETMEEILPRLKVVVVDSEGSPQGVDLSLVQRTVKQGQ